MRTPTWYVITGGPCAGKSTLLGELARRGYRTVPEAARIFIETKLTEGKELTDIRKDELEFQRALIPLKRAAEDALPLDETMFLDRGMHDSLVYLALAGAMSKELETIIQNTQYRKIFLLDLLPFETDSARTENPGQARKIHDLLLETYERSDMPIVQVPVMPVTERADFVLANL